MQPRPVDVGARKQLFLDNYVIDRMRNVQRQFHRPVRYAGNPVIQADRPWESGGGTYLFGGTVFYDEEDRIFKMWYRSSAPLEFTDAMGGYREGKGGYKACYALSEDGLNWEKPDLGLNEFNGSRHNNLLPPSRDGMEFIRRPNLVKDYEDPDPGRLYKMAYMDNVDGLWGLSKAYSRDGINWRMNVGRPHRFQRPIAPNGILFGWDPRRREYVHYHRKSSTEPADVDGRTVRTKLAVMRTSSPDFETWGNTTQVLERGPDDPPRWSPSHGVDLAGALYTDDLYVGFVDTGTTHYVEDVADDLWESVHSKEFAEYRTELLVSRDGVKWDRVAPNWEFMRPGLWGTWDRDHVGLAKPIVRNDQVLVYYSGSNIPMGSNMPKHPQYTVHNTVVDGQYMGHSIGLATMRLDGFASIEAYDDGGTFTTKPMVFDGDRLVINARAPERPFGHGPVQESPFGTLTVEVLDAEAGPIAGYAATDCDTFSGNQVRHVATWRSKWVLDRLAGAPVRLRFHLRNAALYSFQFRGDALDEGSMNLLSPGSRGRP